MLLEKSSGPQNYIEDCEVCCNPIQIDFLIEDENVLNFNASEVQ